MSLHHFIPEFYLKEWIDPASVAPNRTPYVWKITRDGRNFHHHHPAENIFGIEKGNTLESTGGVYNPAVENILSRIESVLARALRNELPNRQPPNRDQADAINMFFASLLVRVPSSRKLLQQGIAARARIERESAEVMDRSVPDTRLFERNALAHLTHSSLVVLLPELDRMTHRILCAPKGESFLSSDRPAVISSSVGFAGLANRFCEAWLPLSPHMLLLLTHDGVDDSGYYDISNREVLSWNQRIVAHSAEWFISKRRDGFPLV